jgi:hypothetical protein
MDWAKQVRSLNRRLKRNARLTRGLRRRAKAQMEQPPALREPIDTFTFPPARRNEQPPGLDFDKIRVFIETGWDEVSTKDDDLEPLRSRGASRTSRRSHLLVAGFEGTCVICLKPISIGDRIAIAYREDSFAIARRRGSPLSPLKVEGWRHYGCPQRASRGVPSRAFRRINERLRGRRRNRGEGDD